MSVWKTGRVGSASQVLSLHAELQLVLLTDSEQNNEV